MIKVEIHTMDLLTKCDRAEKRVAYATVNALTKTLKDAADAVKRRDMARFVIRKPEYFFGTPGRPGGVAARISPFPNVAQQRFWGEISTGARAIVGTEARSLLLPQFETGGPRLPLTPGAKSVAVPLTGGRARPSIRSSIVKAFTFPALAFKAYRAGRRRPIPRRTTRSGALSIFDEFGRRRDLQAITGAKVQWKGKERTFILTHTDAEPHGGVYQRVGPGRADVRLVWAFRRQVQLDSRLQFVVTVTDSVNATFRENLEQATIRELRGIGIAA